MSTQENGFACWAIVEVMGHHRFAGHASETTIAGAGFVRLDVPENGTAQAFSKLFAPASIYAITPVSEAVARELAAGFRAAPVNEWDLPRLRAPEPRVQEALAAPARPCCLCEYPAPDAFCARCGASQEPTQVAPYDPPSPPTIVRDWTPVVSLQGGDRVLVHVVRGVQLAYPQPGTVWAGPGGVSEATVSLDGMLIRDEAYLHTNKPGGRLGYDVFVRAEDCSVCDFPDPQHGPRWAPSSTGTDAADVVGDYADDDVPF